MSRQVCYVPCQAQVALDVAAGFSPATAGRDLPYSHDGYVREAGSMKIVALCDSAQYSQCQGTSGPRPVAPADGWLACLTLGFRSCFDIRFTPMN